MRNVIVYSHSVVNSNKTNQFCVNLNRIQKNDYRVYYH